MLFQKTALLFVIDVVLGGIGAWMVVKWGHLYGLLDQPKIRSSHKLPTPKGGGIGLLAAFIFSCLWLEDIPPAFIWAATIVSATGLVGDRIDIPVWVRLAIQAMAALILLAAALSVDRLSHGQWLLIPVWAVYIIGTTNFFNFMDGINGISATTSLVAFGLIAFYTQQTGSADALVLLAVGIGMSCIGFMPFNVPTARVFMGDVGSILLGFAFAGLVFLQSRTVLDFLCMVMFCLPYYMDELTTMVFRLKRRENLFKAHRRHLYQLLANEGGVAHWKVSAMYGLLQLVLGAAVLYVKPYGMGPILMLLSVSIAAFAAFSAQLRKKLEATV